MTWHTFSPASIDRGLLLEADLGVRLQSQVEGAGLPTGCVEGAATPSGR